MNFNLAMLSSCAGSVGSHMRRWMRMGCSACRCSESFWLMEIVSKHRMGPDEETIQGSTFSLESLDITKSLDATVASLYSCLSLDRVDAASLSSLSITEDI